jgi:hypothetical protein
MSDSSQQPVCKFSEINEATLALVLSGSKEKLPPPQSVVNYGLLEVFMRTGLLEAIMSDTTTCGRCGRKLTETDDI